MESNHKELIRPDNIIIEFLEVSLHQLLYIHQIYPAGIFSRKQKYGVPVQVSGHPLVNNYITQCLKTALELLKQNQLAKLMLVFCSNNGDVIKTIVFDVTKLQRGIMITRQDEERVEMAFRDVFVRLSICDRCSRPVPPGCTFKILLSTQEQSHIDMSKNTAIKANQDFPWTRTSYQQVKTPAVVPLSSLDSCGIELQVYAEEGMSTQMPQLEL